MPSTGSAVAPRNILFDDYDNAVLCDFGLARAGETHLMTPGVGMNRYWMAPEAFLHGTQFEVSFASDVRFFF